MSLESKGSGVSSRILPSDPPSRDEILRAPVLVLGAGPAGLITAYTLLKDGFSDVTVFTKDKTVGGVWSRERVYSTMNINNVHGQYRFSALPMPPPEDASKTGGRLRGEDMRRYFEDFYMRFLGPGSTYGGDTGVVQFGMEVTHVERGRGEFAITSGSEGWNVHVKPTGGEEERMWFARLVLCSGGCITPTMPTTLSPTAARMAKFKGPVVHTVDSWNSLGQIVDAAKEGEAEKGNGGTVVVIGGGKSAQDIAAHLASIDVKVTVVYSKLDMFLASPKPIPNWIRQSRMLSVLSPSMHSRSTTERLLHKTRLGGKFVQWFWTRMAERSFKTYAVPPDHPLRQSHSVFWAPRTGDEGIGREGSFQALVMAGKIELRSGKRCMGFMNVVEGNGSGTYLLLSDGERLTPSAVVLATGYRSSWDDIFETKTQEDIGLVTYASERELAQFDREWDKYHSLRHPPATFPTTSDGDKSYRVPGLYKGLVPAKSILRGDIAVNGATSTSNAGYTFEIGAHWISSYFLQEPMSLPASVEEAEEQVVRSASWLRRRFPGQCAASANASYGSAIPHFAWPQAGDALLADMYLARRKSAGRGLSGVLKPVRMEDVEMLSEERMDCEGRRKRGKIVIV